MFRILSVLFFPLGLLLAIIARRRERRRPTHRIQVEDEAVCVIENRSGAVVWRIPWSEVKEIAAWKEDLFGYDLICLGFRTIDDPEYCSCHEDQPGWDALNAAIETHFGVRNEDWWPSVAFPAFRRNWTTLWGTAWPWPCLTCAYDLRAHVPGQLCPECGAPIPKT
jgi:hypothetical protein